MSAIGSQPLSVTATGLNYVLVLKPGLIGDRHCVSGDIIQVEKVPGHFHHTDKRLTESHAQSLINSGHVRLHMLRPGDRVISIVAPESMTTEQLEAATNPAPAKAERGAVCPREGWGNMTVLGMCLAMTIFTLCVINHVCRQHFREQEEYQRAKASWRARQERLFEMQKATGKIFEDDCLAVLEKSTP